MSELCEPLSIPVRSSSGYDTYSFFHRYGGVRKLGLFTSGFNQ